MKQTAYRGATILETGIKEKVMQEITELAKKNNVTKLVLFGSRARGDFHRTSDIDLAVSGGSIYSFIADVNEETSTLLEFDIVNLDGSVQKELLEMIQKEGKIIYEKI
ncbi:MAG: nucleotidyltransferase domain-containing protein [Lachnospiraceae bacterium]|nr:nucleotidyltransferase domain-containing protein [Lachnospiraceae bacterium]